MRIFVIGSGAREDAIVWSLINSGHKVFAAPGNPGMGNRGARCIPNCAADNIDGLLESARKLYIDLTIVGPEGPLEKGIVDRFRQAGLKIIGPTKAAARLETSKIFAKQFMTRYGIPTADYDVCDSFKDAVAVLHDDDAELVLKADGLAAGKGVKICHGYAEAVQAADEMMNQKIFGEAGARMLIEERLHGPECSAIFDCDGLDAVPLLKAQDYKRRFDNDYGPNTGGMGAICPVFDDHLLLDLQIFDTIIRPTLAGMAELGTPFTGFLYVGLMLTPDRGPMVIEFNVRLGDPETSVILPLLKSDLGEVLMLSTTPGGLEDIQLEWSDGYATCVVPVSEGYPKSGLPTGFAITGVDEAEAKGCLVFHAGTKRVEDRLLTAGGRVLNVVGLGPTTLTSSDLAYLGVRQINFQTMDCRLDIGQGDPVKAE